MPRSVAVVTGASSGIGRALALALAEAGIEVVGVARRRDRLDELQAQNANITAFVTDLSTSAGREELCRWICDRNLSIRYLAHSIGTVQPIRPIAQLSLEEWRTAQAINLEAPLFTTLALADRIVDGRVLFVGSASASRPRQGWGAYCCAKSALHMAQRCLKLEWSDRRVLVSSAKPGPVATDIMKQGLEADIDVFPDRALFEDLKTEGRVASPHTVAQFLRWLLLDCPADDFSSQDWEISDAQHHKYWLSGNLYGSILKNNLI